jgi:hypothetical protein
MMDIMSKPAATYPMFRNQRSGRCLEADYNQINSNGAKLQLWDCNGANWQRWVGDLFNGGLIKNYANGRCMNVKGANPANGTPLIAYDCSGVNEANQNFFFIGDVIKTRLASKCVDANTVGGNGTQVYIWDCNGSSQQNWYIVN